MNFKIKVMRTPFIQIIILISLLVYISSCSISSTTKTEEQLEHEMALKYKIKSISEYQIDSQFGLKKKELNYFRLFDEKGLKQKEIAYFEGSIENIITFEYDINSNLLNSNAIKTDSSFLFKIARNYYENNLRKELYFYLPNGTYKYRNFATYDNSGKMIELKYYWPDGLKAINNYVYEGDKKTEDTETAPDGKFRYKWIYKYDKNGNLVEAVQYYPNNIINAKITYEYNSDNLLTKQINYSGESISIIYSFTYNDKKLLSSKTETTSSGMIAAKFGYEYEFY